jgi:hypothetical protein
MLKVTETGVIAVIVGVEFDRHQRDESILFQTGALIGVNFPENRKTRLSATVCLVSSTELDYDFSRTSGQSEKFWTACP